MTEPSMAIGPMARIDLNLEVGASDQSTAMYPRPGRIHFIYGIGAQGLSPFERLLHGKSRGDSIHLCVEKDQAHGLFEHLACELLNAVGCQPPFNLKVSIASVKMASSREVVKAMAQMGGCGGDCGCGCKELI